MFVLLALMLRGAVDAAPSPPIARLTLLDVGSEAREAQPLAVGRPDRLTETPASTDELLVIAAISPRAAVAVDAPPALAVERVPIDATSAITPMHTFVLDSVELQHTQVNARRRLSVVCPNPNVVGDLSSDPLRGSSACTGNIWRIGCTFTRTCREDYSLSSPPNMTCTSDPGGATASWTNTMPTCTIILCPVFSPQIVGAEDFTLLGGVALAAKCRTNIRLPNCRLSRRCASNARPLPSEMECRVDPVTHVASWSAAPPACAVACPDFPRINDGLPGSLSDRISLNPACTGWSAAGFPVGCAVTRTCRKGSVLAPTPNVNVAVCQSNGNWSVPVPTCKITGCYSQLQPKFFLRDIHHAVRFELVVNKSNVNEETIYRYMCTPGYTRTSGDPDGKIMCEYNITHSSVAGWRDNRDFITCEPARCPAFNIANLTVEYTDGVNSMHDIGSEATSACNAGYGLTEGGVTFAYCKVDPKKEMYTFMESVGVSKLAIERELLLVELGGPAEWRVASGKEFMCLECPAGKRSSESSRCAPCLDGMFSDAGSSTCWQCPARGVSCVGGEVIFPSVSNVWFPSKFTEDTILYQCLPRRCTPSLDGVTCAPGHRGTLCASCDEGHALVGTSCVRCVEKAWSFIVAALMMLLIVIILVWIAGGRLLSAHGRARGGTRSTSSSIQRVLLTFIQTQAILSASTMQPPAEVADLFASAGSFADGVSAGSFPLQCFVGWGFTGRTVFYLCVPIAVLLISLMLLIPALALWRVVIRKAVLNREHLAHTDVELHDGAEALRASDTSAVLDGEVDEWYYGSVGPVSFASLVRKMAAKEVDTELLVRRGAGGPEIPLIEALEVNYAAPAVTSDVAAKPTPEALPVPTRRARPPGRVSTAVYNNRLSKAMSQLTIRGGSDELLLSRAELAAVLPPGIKRTDVDRMMRKYGEPIDAMAPYEPRRKTCCEYFTHKAAKRAFKRRARAKTSGDDRAHLWRKHVDMKTMTVFFANVSTSERRTTLPRGAACENETTAAMHEDALWRDDEAIAARRYQMNTEGFARLTRQLENQNVIVAIVTTAVTTIYFLYGSVTRGLIDVFSVRRIHGESYIAASLDERAFTASHTALLVLAGFWLVGFTIGAPLAGFGALVWGHRTGRSRDPRFRTAIGFLSGGYKREYFWWEAMVLARKLVLLAVAAFSVDDGFLQSFLVVAVLSVAIALQLAINPYVMTSVNLLDTLGLITIFVTRLGAILFNHYDPDEPGLPGCRGTFDLACEASRRTLASAIGYSLVVLQIVFLVLFIIVLVKQRAGELIEKHSGLLDKLFVQCGCKKLMCCTAIGADEQIEEPILGTAMGSKVALRANPLASHASIPGFQTTLEPFTPSFESHGIQLASLSAPQDGQASNVRSTAGDDRLSPEAGRGGALSTLVEDDDEEEEDTVVEDDEDTVGVKAQPWPQHAPLASSWLFEDYEGAVFGKFSTDEMLGWLQEDQLHPETLVAPTDANVEANIEVGEWHTLSELAEKVAAEACKI